MAYLVAVLAVASALGIRMLLEPVTGVGAPWVVFFTAVVVASLFGGRGPGICATLLSAPLAAYFFVLPDRHTPSEAVAQAVLFTVDGLILVYLTALISRGRKQAEASAAEHARSEERLRLANEAAQIGSYDYDVRTKLTVASPELYAVLGLPPGASLREHGMRIVHADDRPAIWAGYERSLDPSGEGHVRLEARIVRPDGTNRWLSWVGRTYFEHTTTGRIPVRQVGVAVDVTERRQAEAELRELNRNKDEFLAMLSHELRNPLAAIRSGVDVLDRAPAGGQAAQRAHRVIDRQVDQLTRLVDDLLDVTRIARGKLELQRERIELGDLVRRMIDDQRTLVEARRIELGLHAPSEPLWLDGDATRLGQVVGNLLHNAAKFTPEGGRIDVSLGREQDEVVLRVRDTGAGIPAEEISRVFEPFVQLGTTISRADGGLGLGLAMVKGTVELHGGSAVAASAGPGQGAEFTIRLPLAGAAERTVGATAPELSPHRRVLVIEDNRDVAESLQDVLQLMGHDVRVAFDGSSGIAAAVEFHPDVVLCDIGLPGMDGYEVARQLRADDALSGALLVALSGYGQPEDRKRAADAGFARHVVKPPTLEVLRSALAAGA
ncbi:MAG: sensor hybrid histidine kinase [Deltaproteobacteria bacterium]|nr:sensor hybrid histidine kinase [Deltaproteobacteria bacterium]